MNNLKKITSQNKNEKLIIIFSLIQQKIHKGIPILITNRFVLFKKNNCKKLPN